MNIKQALFALLCALSFAAFAADLPPAFTDDFDAAKKRAAKEGKLILADFTGSGWCVWCKRLDDEVFRDPSFAPAVTNDLVLVTLDSPGKNRHPLVKRYDVHMFPTVLVLDPSGGVLAQTGYRKGGASAYVDHLKKTVLPAARKRREEGKAEADASNMPWL
ncbi:MAG: thioredoxin family protein [Kiritimatiellae bacterium]|nr:thioredoxin family protein [Kiritimatiellia bacterium]